jgi:Replication initiation factor
MTTTSSLPSVGLLRNESLLRNTQPRAEATLDPPPTNRGVTFGNLSLEPPRFDWYAATVERSGRSLVESVGTAVADESPVLVKGRYGFTRGWELRRDGSARAVVYESSGREWPHVVATGEDAAALASLLRSHPHPHRVARADVCVDTDSPGAYGAFTSALRGVLTDQVKAHTIVPDNLDHGSTYYVGSGKSEVYARVYEKGKQVGSVERPGWVRYEVEVRPQKERKAWAASASPESLLGASRWSRRFAREVLGVSASAPPVRSRRVSDLDGAIAAAWQQYGGRFVELLEKHDGDIEGWALDFWARGQQA